MAAGDWSYTLTPKRLPALLRKITETGVPDKATQSWLPSIGFTSSNDRRFLNVLRQSGFIDAAGRPTEIWKRYRGGDSKALADGLRDGYAILYRTYPDAHRRSDTELGNLVRVNAPNLNKDTIGRVIATFKTLAELADFDDSSSGAAPQTGGTIQHPLIGVVPLTGGVQEVTNPAGGQLTSTPPSIVPSISINVEMKLPESTDPSVYAAIFRGMRELWELRQADEEDTLDSDAGSSWSVEESDELT